MEQKFKEISEEVTNTGGLEKMIDCAFRMNKNVKNSKVTGQTEEDIKESDKAI